ncbi:deoxyribose-phosphate aldolase [Halorhabdus amylolytica]|uniref:deoxyribose-phosphate aldolase n=1 Tax=Halorhabdus amylolytica TaxID=2559573 RepID=UPI0010AA6DF2|nr:deoxyribose-phosphate aldolase [Halorhabdus amylolytica]
MPYDDVPSRIEHTVLGPETTPEDVIAVLDVAIQYGTGARVPPCYVSLADSYAPGVRLATVIGFPHGQHDPSMKAAEAERAGADGADELEVVPNVGRLKAEEDDGVGEDIAEVIAATSLPVTVTVEAPLLSDGEVDRIAKLAADAGAEYLGTVTGFNGGETTPENVKQISRYLPVKASGDVDSWEQAKAMFDAGASRIGTSSGDGIVEEYRHSRS